MRNYKTPTPSNLREPILQFLDDGKVWQWNDIVESVASYFDLTEADRAGDLFPNGDDRLNRYCANMLKQLTDKGDIVRIDYGLYQINKGDLKQ